MSNGYRRGAVVLSLDVLHSFWIFQLFFLTGEESRRNTPVVPSFCDLDYLLIMEAETGVGISDPDAAVRAQQAAQALNNQSINNQFSAQSQTIPSWGGGGGGGGAMSPSAPAQIATAVPTHAAGGAFAAGGWGGGGGGGSAAQMPVDVPRAFCVGGGTVPPHSPLSSLGGSGGGRSSVAAKIAAAAAGGGGGGGRSASSSKPKRELEGAPAPGWIDGFSDFVNWKGGQAVRNPSAYGDQGTGGAASAPRPIATGGRKKAKPRKF